jgi:recombinational DNA repair protein RecR
MFNVKLYIVFNLLFIVIFFIQNNLQKQTTIQQIMNSCEFKEIIVFEDFEVENNSTQLFLKPIFLK